MRNNIKTILEEKGLSILKLSQAMDKHYSTTHKLVNRETLDTTSLGTLDMVAKTLSVEIKDLYEEKEGR